MKRRILSGFLTAAMLWMAGVAWAQDNGTIPVAPAVPATGVPEPGLAQPAGGVNYDNYKLAPGDAISILVYQEDDMTTQAHLTKDGTVTVPLIGPIRIGGLTCAESADKIRNELITRGFFVVPRVTVVLSAASQKAFVILGQINRPGTYSFSSQEVVTLVQAIAMAGGFTRIADQKKVTIVRDEGGVKQRFLKNAKGMIEDSTAPQFDLRNGDIITVGETFF